jgi:hypothetical protein
MRKILLEIHGGIVDNDSDLPVVAPCLRPA